MLATRKTIITAMLAMAVIFFGQQLTGCATSRQVDEVKEEVRKVRADNEATRQKVENMETMIQESVEAGNRVRTDITMSNDEIQRQMDALLENYNQLLIMVQEIRQKLGSKSTLRPSVGAQDQSTTYTQPVVPQNDTPVETPTEPAIDCGNTYDESFIKVRRGEYQDAIDGFTTYLEQCPNHESVENAHYWIGECYYSLEKYVDAVGKFENLLENYKGSVKTSQALYKLARSKQELGKADEAKKIFNRLIEEHPQTLEASQAKERLKDLN